MTNREELVTLTSHGGVNILFDPTDNCRWDIFEAGSYKKIGTLEVNSDGLVVGADIQAQFQGKGIMTEVVKYLVEQCGMDFYFWPHDGQKYNDARHLSDEGARLANSLINKNLASWINSGQYCNDE